jgi:hypothetical protein
MFINYCYKLKKLEKNETWEKQIELTDTIIEESSKNPKKRKNGRKQPSQTYVTQKKAMTTKD